MPILRAFALALALAATTACVGEGGFKSSNPEYMSDLKEALAKAAIPYREDEDGSIRYARKHAAEVDRVREVLEKENAREAAVLLKDKESLDFMKNLLASKGKRYRIKTQEDGAWFHWFPDNDAQEKEFHLKMVEHAFDLQQRKLSKSCTGAKSAAGTTLDTKAAPAGRRSC